MSRLQHFHHLAQARAQIQLGQRYLCVFHDPHQNGHLNHQSFDPGQSALVLPA